MSARLVRSKLRGLLPSSEVRQVYGKTEHLQLLRAKVLEEAGELALAQSRPEMLEEMVDLYHVLDAFAQLLGVLESELSSAKARKGAARGYFVPGVVWEPGRLDTEEQLRDWEHLDGSACTAGFLARIPVAQSGQRWWCTEHQQSLRIAQEPCFTCAGNGCAQCRPEGS